MIARHFYLHVPFCARRCAYCDFSIAVRRDVPSADFAGAVAHEIASRFPDGSHGELDTLYFGGGTPSRLPAAGIARLLDVVRSRWALAANAEVTLEANPDDVSPSAAAEWLAAGINRVSLGVQSFDDRVLRWMHRSHDAAQIHAAADALRGAGFENWSLDLIFAVPASLGRDWRDDLERTISLRPPHLSCYGLTLEPNTPMARWHARGQVLEAAEESFEAEFLAAHRSLTDAGFEHYEVSNYATPQSRSRHNTAYWQRSPYIGVGPSAHGFDGSIRRWNEREYSAWTARVARGEDPVAGTEPLSLEQIATEEVYLSLRTGDGILIEPSDRPTTEHWEERGWCLAEGNRIRLTPSGWLRLDALATALTASRSHF